MSLIHKNGIGIAGSVLSWTILVSGAVAATVLILSKIFLGNIAHKNGVPLPPGPPATWSWENPLPKENIAHGFTALIEKYGPVVSLRRGNHVTVIIGRMDAANEIMEKEGGSLVDRPHQVSSSDILSHGMRLTLARAGERFRRLRRTAHTHLQPKAAQEYEVIQAETSKDVILDILNDPKQYVKHVHKYAASVILRVTYGKTSPTFADDPEVVRMQQVVDNLAIAFKPGAYLVDRIPWLQYVPGFVRQLKEFRRYELALFRDQLNRVRDDMAKNTAQPSFGKMLLENTDDHRLSDDEMAYLAGVFFGAGSDSSASSIAIMIMAAATHPDAQARVQEELDEVIGRDRVPTFGDWDMLPQLQAFMLEAFRWRPVVQIGFAHRATKDVIWRGQCIPAGATVIGCHWAISRDPAAFPNPEAFNPQRWLTEDGRVRTDMHFYTFGFGRRVCPGQHVANRSVYINLALLLWSFRILERPEAPIDLKKNQIGFRDPIIFHPERFDVDFIPRLEERCLRELLAA